MAKAALSNALPMCTRQTNVRTAGPQNYGTSLVLRTNMILATLSRIASKIQEILKLALYTQAPHSLGNEPGRVLEEEKLAGTKKQKTEMYMH